MRYVGAQTFGGGMDMGLAQAGFTLVGRREQNGGFGLAQCEANRHLLGDEWDAEAGPPAEWSMPSDIDFVVGLPPCSGFSLMSVRAGNRGGGRADWRGIDAPVNSCMWAHVAFAARANNGEGPLITAFESVQGAGKDSAKGGLPLMRALRDDLEQRTGRQYTLHHVFHNAASVGGCSMRRRYFWVASRVPFGIESPHVDRVPILKEAISDLDVPTDQWGPRGYAGLRNFWTASQRNPAELGTDGHQTYGDVTNREPGHFERLAGIFALGPGEWKPGEQMIDVVKRNYDATGAFPPGWTERAIATCLRTDFQGGVYQPQRWKADKAARVIAGNGMTCVIHPWRDRTLTYREVARIMGFPDNWSVDAYTGSGGQAVFGKAVTVQCGKWLGTWVKRALEGDPGAWQGEVTGDREYRIDVTNDFKRVYNEKTGAQEDTRTAAQVKEMEARVA